MLIIQRDMGENMSLFKQLWLAIAGLLVVLLSATLIAEGVLARNTLAQQLYQKNLGHSRMLTQLVSHLWEQEGTRDRALTAEFERGHYRFIEVLSAKGETLFIRERTENHNSVPDWFEGLVHVEGRTAVVPIERFGARLGTLRVHSSDIAAYKKLWDEFRVIVAVFAAALLLAGLIGFVMLRRILKPLDGIVQQAIAISERRFNTIPEPRTPEFKHLATAMNPLSERVRDIFTRDAKRLEKIRAAAHNDPVSGLVSREPFLRLMESILQREDINAAGTFSLVRVGNLAQLNQLYGRKNIDSVIKEIGKALNTVLLSHSDWSAARLNGSDFAVVSPRAVDALQVATTVHEAVKHVLMGRSMLSQASVPGAATGYVAGDKLSEVLARVDAALLASDTAGDSKVKLAQRNDVQLLPMRDQMEHWRKILSGAVNGELVTLQTYPVLDMEGRLIHYEAVARLRWKNESLSAGKFLPWANRLELSTHFDQMVITQALDMAERHRAPISINLSQASMVDDEFMTWISKRLSARREVSHRLWFEVTEHAAFNNLRRFSKLCGHLRGFGCKLGIEHVGQNLSQLGKLHDLGLHYLKIDQAYIRGLDTNEANQTLVKTLSSAAHSIGLKVIALGVESRLEMQALDRAEVDGISGPLVTRQLRK